METSRSSDVLIVPDWPAPARCGHWSRHGSCPGNSLPPFDAFNLGLRSGESEGVVRANRDLLVRALGLPSAPRWLRQVHGTNVVTFERPVPPHLQRIERASAIGAHADGHRRPQAEEEAGDASAGAVFDEFIEPEADAAITRRPASCWRS